MGCSMRQTHATAVRHEKRTHTELRNFVTMPIERLLINFRSSRECFEHILARYMAESRPKLLGVVVVEEIEPAEYLAFSMTIVCCICEVPCAPCLLHPPLDMSILFQVCDRSAQQMGWW